MVIKEVEMLTGMTRANIRFYEKEGLISPARSDNGYRDYSEAEVEELRKIKLLRVLGLSLEDIRAAQSGQKELTDPPFGGAFVRRIICTVSVCLLCAGFPREFVDTAGKKC